MPVLNSPDISLELESRLKQGSAIIGCVLIVVSIINLMGWIFGINWMEPPYIGILSMKVSAAICFLLAGMSLVFRQAHERWRIISVVCASLFLIVVLLILCQYVHIFRCVPQATITWIELTTGYPMSLLLISPAASVLLLCAALGLLFAGHGKQDLPATVVFASGSLGFFSRLFGIRIFHERYGFGLGPFSDTGTDTYLSFLACALLAGVGIAILFSNPRYSLNGLLCSTSRGGYLTRRILPLAVGLPMAWAAMTTAGEFAHLYNQPVRWALFINGTILSFCILSCNIAKRLDDIDKSRIAIAEKRADVVYSLAHDLKVPLIGATQALDLLLKEALGQLQAQQRTLLSVLRESMSDQVWMIENLVYEYKTEEGKETIHMHTCLVDRLLDDCLEKIMPAFQAKNLDVKVAHATPDAALTADSVAMRRVINNLLHNALKHCPRNGQIQIKSAADSDNYYFTIWNSGPVISEQLKSHLFERFWQSEEGQNRHVGNGLGLYICRQIIDAHKGRISCHSEQNEGTSFTVELPMDKVPSTDS